MLMHVTGKVDCFGYVCALQTQSEYSLFYNIIYIMSCVLMFMYYSTVCYFTDIFYTVIWQVSVLFIL